MGFMQMGIGLNSQSNTTDAWQNYFGWDDHQTEMYTDIFTSINIAGAAIGALSTTKLLFLPKLRLLLMLNVVLAVGVSISLIGNFVWVICIGRLIWGIAFGAFSVVSAKMVEEITPVEYGGPFGAMS